MGSEGWGVSNSRDEHVDPHLVGLVVASLVRVGRAARLDEILEDAAVLDASALDLESARRTVAWLERTLLVEQVGQGEWRLTAQLSDAFSPRGVKRAPPEHDLAEVLAWAEETRGAVGAFEAIASTSEAEEGLPPRVAVAAGELSRLRAPNSLRRRYSLLAAFEVLETVDKTSFEIYRARKLASETPTLQHLADQLGVTRERIRQREARVEEFIRDGIESPRESPIHPIGFAAKRIRAEFGPVATADETTAISALVDPEATALAGHPDRMALLLHLAGDYQLDGPWMVVPKVAEFTDAALASLTHGRYASVDEACRAIGELGVRTALQPPWIASRKGFRIVGDVLVRWGQSMADKAVAILEVAGEPLTMEDLYERLGEDKNFRGFKNQVQGEPRIRRRGLRHYGLDAWGGEEYTTIVDEMTQELERQGGSIALADLAQSLAHNFGVSESSVRMYADGPQFDIDAAGFVRRRTGELPVPPSAPLEMTRCCFRLEEGWAYRRQVDHDVLRGSGGGVPISFAKYVGLTPGTSVSFQSPYGEIRCSWPSHIAHIGSLRSVAELLGASEGDFLFITYVSPDEFDVRLTERRSCEAASGFDRLCLESGRGTTADPERAVAEAIGLDPAQPGLRTAIRLRFGERGERDLAAMVPAGRAGDNVLDVLASLGE
jgi:hypothetical protein